MFKNSYGYYYFDPNNKYIYNNIEINSLKTFLKNNKNFEKIYNNAQRIARDYNNYNKPSFGRFSSPEYVDVLIFYIGFTEIIMKKNYYNKFKK